MSDHTAVVGGLTSLLDPTAVTVVGASAGSPIGVRLVHNLLAGGWPANRLHLVNRSGATVHGLPSVASVEDLPGPPGLVFLAVNLGQAIAALESLTDRPDGVVVYGQGAEAGFADDERALRAWAGRTGVPVLGPQATTVLRPARRLRLSTAPLLAAPEPGSVALLMQSTGLGGGVINALAGRQVGLHSVVSIGNATVIGFAELARHLLHDPQVRAIGGYLDSVGSLDDLAEIGSLGAARDVPIVLAVGGRSRAGRAAAQSHTGAVATDRRVLVGVAEQYGLLLVADLDELVWALEAVHQLGYRRTAPGGVGVFSLSGGGCIAVADALDAVGVDLPPPAEATRTRMSASPETSIWNPYDAGAVALGDEARVQADVEAFASDPALSILVNVATVSLPAPIGMEAYVAQTQVFVDAVRAAGKTPFLAAPVAMNGTAPDRVHHFPGVATGAGSKESAAKIALLARWANTQTTEAVEFQPAPRPTVGALGAAPPRDGEVMSGQPVRDLLAGVAVGWPDEVTVSMVDDVADAVARLGLPVVAKAEVGLAHRARMGGVVVGLATVAQARAGYTLLCERFGPSISLVREVAHEREYFIGCRNDAHLGPLVVFGEGGSDVEERAALSVRRAPLTRGQAAALVDRYHPPAEARPALVDAVLSLLSTVKTLAWAEVVELNPVVVEGARVVALDAKVHGRVGSAGGA